MALILKDGYYVDSNNNKWSADKYTLEQAIEVAKTLVDCTHCIDCEATYKIKFEPTIKAIIRRIKII